MSPRQCVATLRNAHTDLVERVPAARRGRVLQYLTTAWNLAECVEPDPPRLPKTAVRNLERAGVPRSVAMKITGYKTERRVPTVRERRRSAESGSPARGHVFGGEVP